jgi:hypothetical protein
MKCAETFQHQHNKALHPTASVPSSLPITFSLKSAPRFISNDSPGIDRTLFFSARRKKRLHPFGCSRFYI